MEESHTIEATEPEIRGAAIDPDEFLVRSLLTLADGLSAYHRHRVLHLERLRKALHRNRPVVLVGNHALDIVDPLLLVASIMRELGVIPRFMAHAKGWFGNPIVKDFAERFHLIPSQHPRETLEALHQDGFLMLYPGAVRESGMRDYWNQPYRLTWEGRTGFLKLALEADADVVFVAAVGSDEAYYQSQIPLPNRLIGWLNGGDDRRYAGMRLRLGAFGVHLIPGLFPLPVQLTHVFSDPIDLGDREEAQRDPDALGRLHDRVWERCQSFLDEAVAAREQYADPLDRTTRSLANGLHSLGL